MNVGPDDFGGSDFDSGFETGWDRMMREHAEEQARVKAMDHPRYDEAWAIARREKHGIDWVVARLARWDAEGSERSMVSWSAQDPVESSDVMDRLATVPEGGLVVMDGARIGG
jgi:hypothetical protein